MDCSKERLKKREGGVIELLRTRMYCVGTDQIFCELFNLFTKVLFEMVRKFF